MLKKILEFINKFVKQNDTIKRDEMFLKDYVKTQRHDKEL